MRWAERRAKPGQARLQARRGEEEEAERGVGSKRSADTDTDTDADGRQSSVGRSVGQMASCRAYCACASKPIAGGRGLGAKGAKGENERTTELRGVAPCRVRAVFPTQPISFGALSGWLVAILGV